MKAVALDVSDLRAAVLLTPYWLARMFGAAPMVLELDRRFVHADWRTKATPRRPGIAFRHRAAILRAMDRWAESELPRARAL